MENHEIHNPDERATEDPVYLAEVLDQQPMRSPPPTSRWQNTSAILVLVSLVLGPVIYLGLPAEVSRWYVAAAMEAREAGDVAATSRYMESASRWAPENPAIHIYGGMWKQGEGDFEGSLAEYNKALEIDDANETALMQRSQVLQHLGRHKQAIADWQKLASSGAMSQVQNRAVYLNGLAYAQALANTELAAALENIESAIESVGANAAMLDTRGFIHYRRGDLQSARVDLDAAVDSVEEDYRALAEGALLAPSGQFGTTLKEYAQSVAVIRYHRSLVLAALDEPDAAAEDRARVRELGFEPGEHLF